MKKVATDPSDLLYNAAYKAADMVQEAHQNAKKTILETIGTGDLLAITSIHAATDVISHSLKALSTTSIFVTKQTSSLFTRTLKISTISILGSIKAVDEIGSVAGRAFRKALLNTAALPHDLLIAFFTGKTDD